MWSKWLTCSTDRFNTLGNDGYFNKYVEFCRSMHIVASGRMNPKGKVKITHEASEASNSFLPFFHLQKESQERKSFIPFSYAQKAASIIFKWCLTHPNISCPIQVIVERLRRSWIFYENKDNEILLSLRRHTCQRKSPKMERKEIPQMVSFQLRDHIVLGSYPFAWSRRPSMEKAIRRPNKSRSRSSWRATIPGRQSRKTFQWYPIFHGFYALLPLVGGT